MTPEDHAYVSLGVDRDTVEVGEWVTFTIRRPGEMQQQIRGDINVQGIESDITDWVLYAFVFRNAQQLTRQWRLQVKAEPGGAHTPGRTVTALLRGVFEDHAVADTSAVRVVVVPAGTRNRGDVGPPDVESATVDGSELIIRYNEALDQALEPGTSAYSVRINGGSGTNPTSFDLSDRTVTLTLGTPVVYGDNVTVSYTAPSTGAIRDEAENRAVDLTNYPVTNNTAAPNAVIDAPATLSLAEGVGTYSYSVSLSRALSQNVTVNGLRPGRDGDGRGLPGCDGNSDDLCRPDNVRHAHDHDHRRRHRRGERDLQPCPEQRVFARDHRERRDGRDDRR